MAVCHLCGWVERIPGGTRETDGLETRDCGGCGREISVVTPYQSWVTLSLRQEHLKSSLCAAAGGERPEFRPKTSQAANAYPAAKLDAARAAKHTSLAAQCCTPEVWAQYKDKLSTGPARPAQNPLRSRLGLRGAHS